MIRTNQLAAALYGTWLILKLDPRGFGYFEKTPGGFARSFIVAAVTAPLQFAHSAIAYPHARTTLDFVPFIIVRMLAFVLAWTFYPFVMLYVGDLLNRRERFFWQMVPYNWVQLAIALPLLALAVMSDVQLISTEVFRFLNDLSLFIFFVYGTFIARVGLQVAIASAFGVVVLDLVIAMITSEIINKI
jgi:hypothetical protein